MPFSIGNQLNNLTVNKLLILLLLTLAFSTGSYVYFSNTNKFSFAHNDLPSNVKGTSSTSAFTAPMPKDSIEISSTFSTSTKSRDLESAQSLESLISFYKNFFENQDWQLVSDSSAGDFYILEFENSTVSSQRVKITFSESVEFGTVLLNIQETN